MKVIVLHRLEGWLWADAALRGKGTEFQSQEGLGDRGTPGSGGDGLWQWEARTLVRALAPALNYLFLTAHGVSASSPVE